MATGIDAQQQIFSTNPDDRFQAIDHDAWGQAARRLLTRISTQLCERLERDR